MPRDEKVAMLKESLAAIGKRIELVLNQKEAAGEDRDRWRRHLWTYVSQVFLHRRPSFIWLISFLFFFFMRFYSFVTLFWPKKVKAAKLEEIHAKMVMKESGPRSTPSEPHPGIPKKPRLGTSVPNMPAIVVAGGRSNGAIQSSSSGSSHTNGRYR